MGKSQPWIRGSIDVLGHKGGNLIERDALLGLRIAVTHSDGLVIRRIAIDGEAEGAPRLVHAGVAFADALLDVHDHIPSLPQLGEQLRCNLGHPIFATSGNTAA